MSVSLLAFQRSKGWDCDPPIHPELVCSCPTLAPGSASAPWRCCFIGRTHLHSLPTLWCGPSARPLRSKWEQKLQKSWSLIWTPFPLDSISHPYPQHPVSKPHPINPWPTTTSGRIMDESVPTFRTSGRAVCVGDRQWTYGLGISRCHLEWMSHRNTVSEVAKLGSPTVLFVPQPHLEMDTDNWNSVVQFSNSYSFFLTS